ncbi:MAG: diaminopimelate decarboxylase [Burkholderiales bacterium]|nr:diaminopimelate decarboxylase [Burkholderiales bacterium]
MNLYLPNSAQFHWVEGQLFCDAVPLKLLANKYGTPLYVYSYTAIQSAVDSYKSALKDTEHLLCYAMKANSNLAVVQIMAHLGTGFDIVSGGELARVIAAGGDPKKVIYSGVGKTVEEIEQALNADILCFNVESAQELERIIQIAKRMGRLARISFRVNPDVDPHTHPYISTGLKQNKFGVAYEEAVRLYLHAAEFPEAVKITGMDCHIGSQITTIEPFVDACKKMLDLADILKTKGIFLDHLDFGGGLGINYEEGDHAPSPSELVSALHAVMQERDYGDLTMVFEAGRSIIGNAGVLLTEVEYLKVGEEKNFCIVDAGMNDMIRPALYQSWMQVVPVTPREGEETVYDIVGPVCETGDWIGKDRSLNVEQGDFLAVLSAGAYGMTMSSHYNTRVKPPEIMVRGDHYQVIRERESMPKLFSSEVMLSKEF